MALAVMYDMPGMTHQRYGAVMRAVNMDKRQPPELWFHAAWEKDDGSGWQFFEVWESPEAYQSYLQEKFTQAMRGRGREFTVTVLSGNVRQLTYNPPKPPQTSG